MNDVEDKLRRALRPIEPPAGFAERVMRALPERKAPAPVIVLAAARPAKRSAWQRFTAPAALAASLIVAVLAGQHIAVENERRAGLAASRELMQALRVTSQKLDVAYQAVQGPASERREPAAPPGEENRS
jgi:negative regulator of sigma E activity